MEERQAILKVDRDLRAVFLHNLTAIFFHPFQDWRWNQFVCPKSCVR